jgi:hypothetical protein
MECSDILVDFEQLGVFFYVHIIVEYSWGMQNLFGNNF